MHNVSIMKRRKTIEKRVTKCSIRGGGEIQNDHFLLRTHKAENEKSVKYKNFLCGQRACSQILARAKNNARAEKIKNRFWRQRNPPPKVLYKKILKNICVYRYVLYHQKKK